ncbi:diphthamide biosynthesis protein [Saccharata proteae CBS 121410]|uniref:2-(3-amino-3-carboxypropyl)histidine synthase subunit 2 n=1 Tax=Saccharata proteae CBS 121410 TaxID=1314787 RepID=A0A9P4HZU5_9PEZI|nr:diphthamide biosynthesis protein [Saccharata proteae CBS 121410]
MTTTSAPPILSTPDTHVFEDPTPTTDIESLPRLPTDQVHVVYEVERTVREIRAGRWKRVALQFPDHMLIDAPRVYGGLWRGLERERKRRCRGKKEGVEGLGERLAEVGIDSRKNVDMVEGHGDGEEEEDEVQLYILGDTSYGACCVDEIAAEHVDADVVVHYGRSCLSPTARLPVIYVFTTRPLDLKAVVTAFKETYPEKEESVILMADIPYQNHMPALREALAKEGYTNLYSPDLIHDPSSPLPNRTVPDAVVEDPGKLKSHTLFHVADPPPALLLTLSSRVAAIHIYPTDTPSTAPPRTLSASSAQTLRRRYALLVRLSTVPVFGILINTLSVANYMHMLSHVKECIAAAGKKSYTFVVGKVNAAKVANFSEVGGWVVIGCWESSLLESKEFWRPIITPFELEVALKGDAERVWTGEWRADFKGVLDRAGDGNEDGDGDGEGDAGDSDDDDSEEESAPPEFDLRTGRYVSHARPMEAKKSIRVSNGKAKAKGPAQALVKRANGDLAQVGGVLSPGAEFLRSQRTWQGLGSDFESTGEEGEKGAQMEEGRGGVARGYRVGEDEEVR